MFFKWFDPEEVVLVGDAVVCEHFGTGRVVKVHTSGSMEVKFDFHGLWLIERSLVRTRCEGGFLDVKPQTPVS